MASILLFGATGRLGKEIAIAAVQQGYELTVVVRNLSKAATLNHLVSRSIVADITKPSEIAGICRGFDIIISALGKSVSPKDHSRPSFNDIDLVANGTILEEALKCGVQKFVYISAFHSERFQHLEYFRVHHAFSEQLIASGIDYLIIKPPAIFSSFLDLFPLAKKGMLFTIGSGAKRTNPIYEVDLAYTCIQSLQLKNTVLEIGGETIYTRRQLNEMMQTILCPSKKTRSIPVWFFTMCLPLLKIWNKNLYDKFAFFIAVMNEDTIAPQIGKMKFEDYVKLKSIVIDK